ncbi:MAG: hypothetical protein JNL57_00175 [Bacteroidetes bacterium]|nr:hypothetical protein [Bacteroidota bacterium]
MLEILAMIWVVKKFASLAFDKGYPRWIFGFAGALSYYVPILVLSLIVLPILVENGAISFDSETTATFSVIGLNLLVGVACCATAYQLLKRMPDKTLQTGDLLDDQTV